MIVSGQARMRGNCQWNFLQTAHLELEVQSSRLKRRAGLEYEAATAGFMSDGIFRKDVKIPIVGLNEPRRDL